jgi:RimJ/RimL family protein N-acetyltransferase
MVEFRTLDPGTLDAKADAFLAIAADVPGEYWTLAHFLAERPEKWRLSFAAWRAGEPVGYAVLSRRGTDHVHLHHFMVARAARAEGLGGGMVAEMARRAAASGARRITLKVAADNERARAFYERHGFRPAGREGAYEVLEHWLSPPVVAIHQPNYLPWLGYFAKMARADIFVFLDDVQFTKGGYTNRVPIDGEGSARWLSVPVRARLGQRIDEIVPSRADWRAAHLDTLTTYYRKAPHFGAVRDWLSDAFSGAPDSNLAAINRHLIEAAKKALGLGCRVLSSSELRLEETDATQRLVRIVESLAPGGTYLAGRGGDKYQDPSAFVAAGLTLARANFAPAPYDQGHPDFLPGLSILDAAFRLGWDGAAALLRARA